MENENYELTLKDKICLWWILITWYIGFCTTLYWAFKGIATGVEWVMDRIPHKEKVPIEEDLF